MAWGHRGTVQLHPKRLCCGLQRVLEASTAPVGGGGGVAGRWPAPQRASWQGLQGRHTGLGARAVRGCAHLGTAGRSGAQRPHGAAAAHSEGLPTLCAGPPLPLVKALGKASVPTRLMAHM